MEKRVLAAIALSILILFLFRYVQERRMGELAKKMPPAPKPPAAATPAPTPAPALPAELPVEKPRATVVGASKAVVAAPRSIVVEGDLYRAVLDNRGAVLTSWILNHYRSGKGDKFELVAATHDVGSWPFPGALVLDDPTLTSLANGEYYEVEIPMGSQPGEVLSPPLTVVMRLRRGDLSIQKTFRLERDNYLMDLSVVIESARKPLPGRILLGQDIGPEYDHLLNPSAQLAAISDQGGSVKREGPPKDEKEVKRIEGSVRWVGLEMQYFAVIAIPSSPFPYFEIQKRPVKTVGLDQKEANRDLLRITLPETGVSEYRIYLGPKKQSFLEAVKGVDLSRVIDYGMFSFLVRPLLYSLIWVERYVHNYGAAIILLTFLLSLLLFPFRLKQMISMKKMQAVQPKIKEIQERYRKYKKTDPRRAEMNREIMAIYKQHNVNPLGGCLPLILQMPLLFAFYSLLAYSIELRQAPFVWWLLDLSAKDPYYILPIVMGVTMFVSQKMTPMAPGTDPTQAKMMMIMPAIFTVMFLNVSSGLNLYFLFSNIFQIGFQKIAERWVGDKRSRRKSKS